MIHLSMFILLSFLLFHVEAPAPLGQGNATPPADTVRSLNQSHDLLIIWILSVIVSITFFVILYAKCHHGAASNRRGAGLQHNHRVLEESVSRFSGIDKEVIESLPFFRFSSLNGSKEGLECSVCLSQFEDSDILRLLPKCNHAFHLDCVDQWLESHSSCPLCRQKVDAIFAYSHSLRFSWNHPQLLEDPNLELFVERERDINLESSSRFSIGGSFRKILKMGKKEEQPTQKVSERNDDGKILHKFKHKIIVPEVVFKSRWSNLTSADVMFLNSEMFNLMSISKRFPPLESNSGRFNANGFGNGSSRNDQIMNIKKEMEKKRLFESKASIINKNDPVAVSSLPSCSDSSDYNLGKKNSTFLMPAEKRSKSEITDLPRFPDFSMRNKISSNEGLSVGNNAKEERKRKLWFGVARRTAQWLAGRERRLEQSQYQRQQSNV